MGEQAIQILDNSQEKLSSIQMFRPDYKIFLFVILLFNTTAIAQVGDAVRLKAYNNSKLCSASKPVILQLMRPTHSTNRTLNTGKSTLIGVFTGEYTSIVSARDGKPIETSRLRVRPITCKMPFGCQHFMPETKQHNTAGSTLEFYNTTNDCVVPKTISIAVNGHILTNIGPGEHKRIEVPKESAYMEILKGPQRLLMTCIDPTVQPYEFYGCTDPKYPKYIKNGVVISFKNSTETCGKNAGFPVILWVDGFPVKGLKSQKKARIAVSKGQHRIQISRKLTGKLLFDRSMTCTKSFLFNYGCGKAK